MKMKIGILGAESTGKSTLALQLADYFGGVCIPEYAREYVEAKLRLVSPPQGSERVGEVYTFIDVENIARRQIKQLSDLLIAQFTFFDTELIVTKVWFMVKYGKVPEWLLETMNNVKPDFCLLCLPDLPFVADPVRENPNLREELTDMYRRELEYYCIPYATVSGSGSDRLRSAIEAVMKLR